MPDDPKIIPWDWTLQNKARDIITRYICQNGHLYTIGDCGNPAVTSKCPECGVPIGGSNHLLVQGSQKLDKVEDETKVGHVLGEPESRKCALPERDLSRPHVCLLRALTHLALLLGAQQNEQAVKEMITPSVNAVKPFLLGHLDCDLQQLGNLFDMTRENVVTAVHILLNSLSENKQDGHRSTRSSQQTPVLILDSTQKRKQWENDFEKKYLQSFIQNLDKNLKAAEEEMNKDQHNDKNMLLCFLGGRMEGMRPIGVAQSNGHWRCEPSLTSGQLYLQLESVNGLIANPLLWHLVTEYQQVRFLPFLYDVLQLQSDLISYFVHRPNLNYKKMSISEFEASRSDAELPIFRQRITAFHNVFVYWRTLSEEQRGLPREVLNGDIGPTTPVGWFLPQNEGDGLCATNLTSFLINQHNACVHAGEKFSKQKPRKVSANEVQASHMVSCSIDQDILHPAVAICEYQLEAGHATSSNLNLQALEKRLFRQLMLGKPIINQDIPSFSKKQTYNFDRVVNNLKRRVKQESLSAGIWRKIIGSLHSVQLVSDVIMVLTVTMEFLASVGADGEQSLSSYIKDVLKVERSQNTMFQVAELCKLKHVACLWQLLSCWRAELLLELRQEPFLHVHKKFHTDLSEEQKRHLQKKLGKSGFENVPSELHQLIQLQLQPQQHSDTHNPDFGLADSLDAFIEREEVHSEETLKAFIEVLPQDIQLSQILDVWKTIVLHRKNAHLPACHYFR